MKFDPAITEQLKNFCEADRAVRDYTEAARLLLRVSGNVVQFNNMMRKGPEYFKDLIDKRLKEYYEFRLAKLTRAQVAEMKAKADSIVAKAPDLEVRIKTGRRDDHDSLPDDIQAAYTQTLDLLHQEQELHRQIRSLALASAVCPDSEIYPFVKEILRIDDLRLSLWKKYDTFTIQ